MDKLTTTNNHLTNRFRIGENAKLVATMNAIKINRIEQTHQIEEVSKCLKYIFTLIGLKGENLPSQVEKMVLVNYIIKNLGNYACEDIINAFEMGIKGTFEANMTHFQKFSSIYLCDILKAYTEHKNKVLRDYINEQKSLLPEKVVTEQEKRKIFDDYFDNQVMKAHEQVQKGQPMEIVAPSMMFVSLESAGLITMPVSEKVKMFKKCKDEYIKSLDNASSIEDRQDKNRIKSIIEKQGFDTQKNKIKSLARVKALKKWFKMNPDISKLKTKFVNQKIEENGKNS